MGAASELFLLAASRLGYADRRSREHPGVEALLEQLDYAEDNVSTSGHRQLIRNRAAILRAGAFVSGLFAAESPDAPGARFFCGTADPGLLGRDARSHPPASVAGCDHDPGPAFERCIGEAVEYLSQLSQADDPLIAAGSGIPPAEGVPRWNGEPQLRAVSLASGAEAGLPARLCVRQPGTTQPDIGTGCAAGRTWTEAINAALWELIERDAVAAWWHGGQAPRRQPESLEGAPTGYFARLRAGASGRGTRFLDISSRPGLPVVAACSFTERGDRFVAGFAAHLDVSEAARKAVREMLQMELGLRFVMAKQALGHPPLNEHERAQARRAQQVTPGHPALRPSAGPQAFDPLPEGMSPEHVLRATVERLRAVSIQAYAADLTRFQFKIPVAKVVAPGLRHVPDEAAWAAIDHPRNIPLF